MAITQNSVVVGVFPDDATARGAIEALRRAGFSDDELGILVRADVNQNADTFASDTATGAVSGGVVGGVLGALASLLIPGFGPVLAGGIMLATLGGAAVGGIVGALVSMGVGENDAKFYQKELSAGHTIVTVKAPDDPEMVQRLLKEQGATKARTHFSAFNATPPLRPFGSPPDTYDPTVGPGSE
jgi:hypothetical protein